MTTEVVESKGLTAEEIEAVVDRLKKDQAEDSKAGFAKGLRDGAEWAKDDASLADLRRIAESQVGDVDLDELLNLQNGDDALADGYDYDSFSEGYVNGLQGARFCVECSSQQVVGREPARCRSGHSCGGSQS